MAAQAPYRRDKVSIAGHVGSGKSTAARLLSERTGWRLVSTGALFRDIAGSRGLSVLELNRHAEIDPSIDDEVDGQLRRLAAGDEPLVIDSRMAWHFVPASLKVYLVVDPGVGAERVHGASRLDERYETLEEAAAASSARQRAEADRYHTLYGVVRDDWRNYELVIDTTDSTPEHTVDLILRALESPPDTTGDAPVCWLSPRRLLPTEPRRDAVADGVLVSVVSGAIVLTAGHREVSEAIESGARLVRCRLAAFEPDHDDPVWLPAGGTDTAVVSPSTLDEWQERHGFRFRSVPEWLASR